MFVPKPISTEALPAALEKAHRYRLLNDPEAAESICLDVLAAEHDNQDAAITLLLAITDQAAAGPAEMERRARELLPRIRNTYKRAYYEGVICERRAKAHLKVGAPGAGEMAYEWLRQAMEHYEEAERHRPPGNDEALLRWNTCARILARHGEHVHASAEERYQPSFD